MSASDAVLDTCCLINLAAAGDLLRLMSAGDFVWHLPRSVEAQGVYVRSSADPADKGRRAIDLGSLVQAGALHRCDVAEADQAFFLQVAAEHGDDADAAALTIAARQGWLLATDDRRLTRVANSHGVQTLTTPRILQAVAAAERLSPTDIQAMLRRVEQLGRWRPRDTDPDAPWWKRHAGG